MDATVVTGGGGFLGKALCRYLAACGRRVISLSRGAYPELEDCGVRCVRCDIAEPGAALERQFEGVDTVFHTAAKVEMWGRYDDFYRVNVIGTRSVIEASRRAGVKRLVFTSSPSVIAHGGDLLGVNESLRYPRSYKAHYPRTKALAEQEVLAANREGLMTLALRPHLIWGPGDTNLVPRILERARSGRLVRVGDGTNLTDLTYIDDCVRAHIAAEDALMRNPGCRGKAYFISQGKPVNMWSWINSVLEYSGLPPVTRRVPKSAAYALAWLLERKALMLGGSVEPRFTRFLVEQMATSHYFDISAARRDLGFEPHVSLEEALRETFGAAPGGSFCGAAA